MTLFSSFKLFFMKVGGLCFAVEFTEKTQLHLHHMFTEPIKILVAHPLHEIRDRIASQLERKGYYVTLATNGLDGLFAGYYEKFALIISAMALPKITGFEMVRTLQTHSSNNGTPTIFIGTGHESPEIVAISAKLNAMIMPVDAITNSISKVDESATFGDLLSWVKIDFRPQ